MVDPQAQSRFLVLEAWMQKINDQLMAAGTSGLSGDGSGGIATSSGTSLTCQTAALTSNVTLATGGQYYDGPSLSLSAGTYLVSGQICVFCDGTNYPIDAKLWDGGSNVYASGEFNAGGATNADGISVIPFTPVVIVLASAATIKISASEFTSGGSDIIYAHCPSNNMGNNASYITALAI